VSFRARETPLRFRVGNGRTKAPNQPRLRTDQQWLALIPPFQFD
jgi:hypothetical protein